MPETGVAAALYAIYLIPKSPTERHMLWGTYLDHEEAHATARKLEGVVVELPITADYRTQS